MSQIKQKTMSQVLQNTSGPIPFRMTNDYLFKALLQQNKTVLKAFVSSLLKLEPDTLSDLTVTNPIILGEKIDEKEVVLDVNVQFTNDTMLDLEMQVVQQEYWPARSLYYTMREASRLKKGQPYDSLSLTHHIGLLDFQLFADHPFFYDTYKLMSIHDHYVYTDLISIGCVDLTNIDLASEEDRRYNVDKWAGLFKCTTWEEIKMLAKDNAAIMEAAETIYEISEDERIRQRMEAREDYYRCQRTERMRFARLRQELSDAKQEAEDAKQEAEDARQALADKDAALADKNAELASSRVQIADKDAEIARLRAELAGRK